MYPMLQMLWLAIYHHRRSVGYAGHIGRPLGVLLGLGLLLAGCNNSGNQGGLTPQSGSTPALERQAVDNLLTGYRTALRQADIDLVDDLLVPTAPQTQAVALGQQCLRPPEEGAVIGVQALRATLAETFSTRTVTALDIPADTLQVAPDNRSVTFLEVESTEDPVTLVQQTRLFRTCWGLNQDEVNGTVKIRIGAVQREGPLIQVTTLGQVQAGALTRVEVGGTDAPFSLVGVEVAVPDTRAEPLTADPTTKDVWEGVFTPPMQLPPKPLRIQLHGTGGEALVLQHPYRLRVPGEGVVTRVAGTETTRVFAVTVAPDGTVWAGGDAGATLYQVPPGTTRATQVPQVPRLPEDPDSRLLEHPASRVEAMAVDHVGRLHALILDLVNNGVAGHAVFVHDPACSHVYQTVNIIDAAYPFQGPDGRPSASTRVVAAGDSIWLFGSDGGVARVQDSFQDGQCPAQGLTVRYNSILQRANSALPTNIVPALVAEPDGTLWLGTALGLTRFQQGHFTPVPFNPSLTVPGDVATLERFFQAVAQALLKAQPLTTLALGEVSFLKTFGQRVVKGDLIFSAVAVGPGQPGQLWVGTLGGGLRRIDGRGATPKDTQRLTRLDGLPSNQIFALAVAHDAAHDGDLWVATDKGVSRLHEAGGSVTTFAALDGLAGPVHDVAVDAAGTVWLATDGGLFRIVPDALGGKVQGQVLDEFSQPVVGADVTLQGTPFHAVTDAMGNFVLANLPTEPQQLQVDGRLAVSGPFTVALRAIAVLAVPDEGPQTLQPTMLKSLVPRALNKMSGDGQMGTVGTPLAHPLVVAVMQAGRIPVPGVPVTFKVTAGRGTLAPPVQPVLTDAQGLAEVILTLGTQIAVQQVTATAPGLASVTFTIGRVMAGTGRQVIPVSGDNQVGEPGNLLPEPLVIQVEDQFGNPVEGEPVQGLVMSGGVGFVNPTLADEPQQPQPSRTEMTGSDGRVRFFVQADAKVSSPCVHLTAFEVAVQFLLHVTRIPVGNSPFSVVVADLNGDRIPDLVTANQGSNDVSVLLGLPDGTFAAAQSFAVGNDPVSVAVADLNGDGIPDLVTANQGSNDVSVLLGLGDGTFAAAQPIPLNGKGPVSVAVADFNGDGKPDLVTANVSSNDVSVLLGLGDGTFAAEPSFAVGKSPVSVVVAKGVTDLNGDGKPDLVTANQGSNDVSVLLGLGDGTFAAEQRFAVGVSASPTSVAVADLNGDGIPDLAITDKQFSAVTILLGGDDGTFVKPQLCSQ